MKKMFLSLLMALVCLGANAQFEAHKSYVNTSLSGLGLGYNKANGFMFGLDATGGYLFARDWMVLGRFGYNHPGDNINELEIGAGCRYYIEQNGLSLGLGLSYGHTDYDGAKVNHCYLTPEIGYTFFLNQHVTIEPAVYYKMCLDDFADASTVGLKIGFGYFF